MLLKTGSGHLFVICILAAHRPGKCSGTDSRPSADPRVSNMCRSKTWASGTGYGSGRGWFSTEVWDPQQAASAQDAQDAELRRVMSSLAAALGCDIPSAPAGASADGLQPTSSDGSFEAIGSGARQPHPAPCCAGPHNFVRR